MGNEKKHRHIADLTEEELDLLLGLSSKLGGSMAHLGIDNRPEWYAVNRIARDLLAESDRRSRKVE
jgi:hypothetical protein